MTIRELAEFVVELSGSKSKIVYMPLPKDDPKQRQPNIGLARERLGWQPAVALRDGLERTIAYFDGILGRGIDATAAGAHDEPVKV
jgi:UDP-glucuronate decarboxylase